MRTSPGRKRRIGNLEAASIKRHRRYPAGRGTKAYPLKPHDKHYSKKDEEEITRILSSHKTWLSDIVIDAAQSLLAKQFPHITGFQTTVILQGSSYGGYAAKGLPFVQIVNVNSHWISLSNSVSGTVTPGTINCYDSMHRTFFEIPHIIKNVSASLMFLECNTSITVQIPSCKQQIGSNDCGLFAIANATAVCFGFNPSHCVWKQNKMRPHLARCMKNGKMEMFPHDVCQLTSDVYTTTFDVFCHCRLPYVEGDSMIECNHCKSWYHRECENISSSRWQKLEESNMAYVCSACQQLSR